MLTVPLNLEKIYIRLQNKVDYFYQFISRPRAAYEIVFKGFRAFKSLYSSEEKAYR